MDDREETPGESGGDADDEVISLKNKVKIDVFGTRNRGFNNFSSCQNGEKHSNIGHRAHSC